MLRIVLDTSVLVAGLRSRNGPNNALLRAVAEGQFLLLCTPPLFLEYEDVLKRSEQIAVHGLSSSKIDDFMTELAAIIIPVDVRFQWRPQIADPDDEMVLEAAINGNADALVTNNLKDFAGIPHHFNLSGSLSCKNAPKGASMNKAAYPLKLPNSIKRAAQRLAKEDGVSLNQWISSAVAQKVGAVETSAEFFAHRAARSKGTGLMPFLLNAPNIPE